MENITLFVELNDEQLQMVTGGTGGNHQVLHQKRLMTLEARAVRNRDFHHLVFDADPQCHLAAEPPLALSHRLRRLGSLIHAAWFDRGPALQAFQPGDLFALLGNNLFQCGDFAE